MGNLAPRNDLENEASETELETMMPTTTTTTKVGTEFLVILASRLLLLRKLNYRSLQVEVCCVAKLQPIFSVLQSLFFCNKLLEQHE